MDLRFPDGVAALDFELAQGRDAALEVRARDRQRRAARRVTWRSVRSHEAAGEPAAARSRPCPARHGRADEDASGLRDGREPGGGAWQRPDELLPSSSSGASSRTPPLRPDDHEVVGVLALFRRDCSAARRAARARSPARGRPARRGPSAFRAVRRYGADRARRPARWRRRPSPRRGAPRAPERARAPSPRRTRGPAASAGGGCATRPGAPRVVAAEAERARAPRPRAGGFLHRRGGGARPAGPPGAGAAGPASDAWRPRTSARSLRPARAWRRPPAARGQRDCSGRISPRTRSPSSCGTSGGIGSVSDPSSTRWSRQRPRGPARAQERRDEQGARSLVELVGSADSSSRPRSMTAMR